MCAGLGLVKFYAGEEGWAKSYDEAAECWLEVKLSGSSVFLEIPLMGVRV